LNRKSLDAGFLRPISAWNEITMNTMYDRISQHRYSSQDTRDFGRDFGSIQSTQAEGVNGANLFCIALGVSGVIFVIAMMICAALH
jgi:hypothetical protein